MKNSPVSSLSCGQQAHAFLAYKDLMYGLDLVYAYTNKPNTDPIFLQHQVLIALNSYLKNIGSEFRVDINDAGNFYITFPDVLLAKSNGRNPIETSEYHSKRMEEVMRSNEEARYLASSKGQPLPLLPSFNDWENMLRNANASLRAYSKDVHEDLPHQYKENLRKQGIGDIKAALEAISGIQMVTTAPVVEVTLPQYVATPADFQFPLNPESIATAPWEQAPASIPMPEIYGPPMPLEMKKSVHKMPDDPKGSNKKPQSEATAERKAVLTEMPPRSSIEAEAVTMPPAEIMTQIKVGVAGPDLMLSPPSGQAAIDFKADVLLAMINGDLSEVSKKVTSELSADNYLYSYPQEQAQQRQATKIQAKQAIAETINEYLHGMGSDAIKIEVTRAGKLATNIQTTDALSEWLQEVPKLDAALNEYVDNLYSYGVNGNSFDPDNDPLLKLQNSRSEVLAGIWGTISGITTAGMFAAGIAILAVQHNPGAYIGLMGSGMAVGAIGITLSTIYAEKVMPESPEELADMVVRQQQRNGKPVQQPTAQQTAEVIAAVQQEANKAKSIQINTLGVLQQVSNKIGQQQPAIAAGNKTKPEQAEPKAKTTASRIEPKAAMPQKPLTSDDRKAQQDGIALIRDTDNALKSAVKGLSNLSAAELKDPKNAAQIAELKQGFKQSIVQACSSRLPAPFSIENEDNIRMYGKKSHLKGSFSKDIAKMERAVDKAINAGKKDKRINKMLDQIEVNRKLRDQRHVIVDAENALNAAVEDSWKELLEAMSNESTRKRYDALDLRGDLLTAMTATLTGTATAASIVAGALMIAFPSNVGMLVGGIVFVSSVPILGITGAVLGSIEVAVEANSNTAQAMIDLLGRDAVSKALELPEEQRGAALDQAASKAITNVAKLDKYIEKVVESAHAYDQSKGQGRH